MNVLQIIFYNIITRLLNLNRTKKRLVQIGFDCFAIMVALFGALLLQSDLSIFHNLPRTFGLYFFIIVPSIIIFMKLGLYRAFIRYVSTEISILVMFGSCLSAFFFILAKLMFVPLILWSTAIIYTLFLFITVTGSRFTMRHLIRVSYLSKKKNVAIYGAGDSGSQLLLNLTSDTNYKVKMIIDDNQNFQGHRFYGFLIMSFEMACKKFEELGIDVVLLAMPSLSFSERQRVITKLNEYALQVKIIPTIKSLINGSSKITNFREISIDDLLERQGVEPIPDLLSKNIYSKSVLVTGAGGSIGSELCRQIIKLKPRELLILDVSEIAVYAISAELELEMQEIGVNIYKYVGSIQDRLFIANVLHKHKIDTIYHAAAYKHVPLMEQNVIQAIKNNTIGTMVLADEALRVGIESFTLISTDKAVNPTNIMGASKRMAELICQSLSLEDPLTKFSIVRFGNVLGSSGSVVPLFKKQIEAGGPITLSHPNVTRFFMTIREAVELVIQSNSLAQGGETFILEMGSAVKIKDLAFKMVKLLGLRPYFETETTEKGDIPIRITNLRPGEKMYEELSYNNNYGGTLHPRIKTVNENIKLSNNIRTLIDNLNLLLEAYDYDGIIKFLIENANYSPIKKSIKEIS